jgi:uncharacterized protein (TIGR02246 family)
MRTIVIAFAVLGLATSAPVGAQAAPESTAEVRAVFDRYDQGWRTFDADMVTELFADDFDWVNSVGIRITDKTKLHGFLTHLFANPKFRKGQSGALVIKSIRMLGPDTAVVLSYEKTFGQVDTQTENVVPEYGTDELTVMVRRGGRWLIVSDLSADEAQGI